MKISSMLAFSVGAISSVMLVKTLQKSCPNQMVNASSMKDKIMKIFE